MAAGRMAVGRKVALLGGVAAMAFSVGRLSVPTEAAHAQRASPPQGRGPPSAFRQLAAVSGHLATSATDPVDALLDAQARAQGAERGRLLVLLGRTGRQEALPVLLEAADASSPAVRDGAIAGLGEHADPEAVARLTALCDHPSGWVRGAAAKALVAAATEEARDHLERLVFGPDEPLGKVAVEAMATWPDARSIALLLKVVHGRDVVLAGFAIDTLAALQGPEALDALLSITDDPEVARGLRGAATAAAGARGPDAASRLTELALTATTETADAALDALIEIGGDEAVEALSALAERRPSLGYGAVAGLARIGSPAATDALIALVRSPSPTTAQNAAAELIDVRGEAVDAALLEVLEGGGHAAERVIGRLAYTRRGPAFAKAMLATVEEGDPLLATRAVHALAKQDPEVAASALRRIASRPGAKQLRVSAVDALVEMPGAQGREALAALSRDPSLPRAARVRAQRALLGSSAHEERAKAGLLENARRAGDPSARTDAVSALAEIADAELASELASLIETAPPSERFGLASAMAGVDGPSRTAITQAVLALEDEEQRLDLLSNLVHLGDAEAIGALDDLAAGDSERARRALGSLAYVDPAAATGHAERLLDGDDPKDREAALRVYQATGSAERLDVARSALDDEHQGVRREAIRQLVDDARPAALEALVRTGRQHPRDVAPQAGALLATGDPDAERWVRDLVLTGDEQAARDAVNALLFHHDPAARALVEELSGYETERGADIRARLETPGRFDRR
jgi:HEAT repeat protein